MAKIKRDKADELFSLYIRTRDNWTCQRCHKQYPPKHQGLHASHFVGRSKENTRFDPNNVVSLDFGCHQYFTSHPAEHYDWQVQRLGQEAVDKLKLSASLYKKKDREAEKLYWRNKLMEDFKIKA